MNVDDYKSAVIAFFKSGKANSEHWEEMAQAVLIASEHSGLEHIDPAVGYDPEVTE